MLNAFGEDILKLLLNKILGYMYVAVDICIKKNSIMPIFQVPQNSN